MSIRPRHILTQIAFTVAALLCASGVSLAGQPFLLKDINTAATGASSNSASFVTIGTVTFFVATDATNGRELWKTDGTEGGTVLLKDIHPGSSDSNPAYLTAVGGTLFFTADDGTHGTELWKSDGTPSGTVMVKDMTAGSSGSSLRWLTASGGKLFFTTAGDTELWKSDGTAAGTVQLSTNTSLGYLTDVNGVLFFAVTSQTGADIWKSNGLSTGTVLVKRVYSGTPPFFPRAGFYPENLTNVGGVLYFTKLNGRELWKSNGSAAGTVIVKDFTAGSDGPPTSFTLSNGKIFFWATDGVTGPELWTTDGTAAGTVLVKDIFPGASGSYPTGMAAVGGTVFFQADDGIHGKELWKSDGTAAGTAMVKEITPGTSGGNPARLTAVNDILYFVATDEATGTELWKSDGTAAGTALAMDIIPGAGSSNPSDFGYGAGTFFFSADDGTHGAELWSLSTLPALVATPTAIDFGQAPLLSPTSAIVTLSNSGDAPLSVSSVTVAGVDSGLFSVAPGGANPCASLTPAIPYAGSCTISVTFTPTEQGAKSSLINIVSSAGMAEVTLGGTGVSRSYSLVIPFAGSGTGSVQAEPAPPGFLCRNDCTQSFPEGAAVSLTATADAGSYFAGWSGCDQISSGVCAVAMNGGRSVPVLFERDWPILIGTPGVGFGGTIQEAYDSLQESGMLTMKAREFTGDVVFNRDIHVGMQGGCNANLSDCSAMTLLNGKMTIRSGSVSVGNFSFR